jgi:hypothetical protein
VIEESSVLAAVVQVGVRETPYLRCGRGAPAIILATAESDRLRLLHLLGRHFGAIAPVLPWVPAGPPDPALGTWLRGVIDGLGLQRPTVVLTAALGKHASVLTDSADEVLGRVVVEHSGAGPALLAELGIPG